MEQRYQSTKYSTASQAMIINLFFKLSLKFKFANLNIWFNNECLKNKVFPKYVCLKTKCANPSARRALHRGKITWLKSEVQRWYKARDLYSLELYGLHQELCHRLHNIELSVLQDYIKERVFQTTQKKKIRQVRKLNKLLSDRKRNNPDFSPTTIPKFHPRIFNLSSTQFPQKQLDILNMGLKFSPPCPPNTHQIKHLCVQTDIITDKTNTAGLKHNLSKDIERYIHKTPHTPSFVKTLKDIKSTITNSNVIITKADKGNTTVLMDRSDYNNKIYDFIEHNNITELKKDPTIKYIASVKSALRTSETLFSNPTKILPPNPQTPRLYGLPKIHKPHIPIRPVVSYTHSITHRLAFKLNKEFHTHIKFTPKHTINSSLQLVNKIKDLTLPPNTKLVSFDVSNLFPSIPISDCKSILIDILDKSPANPCLKNELFELISTCLDVNYFKFDDKYFIQKSGLPMGSPLSPLLADIFMNDLETKLFESAHPLTKSIIYWFRYVDDILAAFNGTDRQLTQFTQFLNTLHPSIKFTNEIQDKYNSLNFLDLKITLINNKHEFNIYRKPSYTDTVIHNSSLHPTSHKHAVFHSMIHRLISIPLSKENFDTEIRTIKQIAINNAYSPFLIDKLLKQKQTKINTQSITSLTPFMNPVSAKFSIPFLGSLSFKIANTFKKEGICIVFHAPSNLNKFLSYTKDYIPSLHRSGVYRLSCSDCNSAYIGQTGRKFQSRINEHMHAFKLCTNRSHFATHLLHNKHKFNINTNVHILEIENNYTKRIKLETLHIHQALNNNFNIITLNQQIPDLTSPLLNLALKQLDT